MAQKTVYTCDRCKKEYEKSELRTITLTMSEASWLSKTFDICFYCRVETNLENYTEEQRKMYMKNKAVKEQPTLEQVILDFLHDEIVEICINTTQR